MLKETNFSHLKSLMKNTGDSKIFENLVEDLDLENCLVDGAYDTEDIFELLEEKRSSPQGVKIRKNATPSLSPGGKAVREFQEQGYEKWKEVQEYGERWSVEGFFSSVKRCFGETVRATSPKGMIQEVKRKFALYNLITKI